MTRITYQSVSEHLIVSLKENEIVRNLKLISQTFTQKRDNIDKMYADEAMIASYACFYLPTNIWKMKFLLERLSEEQIASIKDSHVIEIGTGPGTYILALMEFLGPEMISFFGIDHNPLMLKQARKLTEVFFPTADCEYRQDIPVLNDNKKVTLIFGNSLNEMGEALALKIINSLNVENIICIEPGTKQSFSHTQNLRESLVKSGFNIAYPCQGNQTCPITKNKLDDWCHQVVKTKLDFDTQRLSQLINLDRSSMPAIIHFYGKKDSIRNSAVVMRQIRILKHAFVWEICHEVAGELKLQVVEVPKKVFSKSQTKEISDSSTGFRIEFSLDKELPENVIRIKDVILK